jgi:hypothetical protein
MWKIALALPQVYEKNCIFIRFLVLAGAAKSFVADRLALRPIPDPAKSEIRFHLSICCVLAEIRPSLSPADGATPFVAGTRGSTWNRQVTKRQSNSLSPGQLTRTTH